MQPGLGFNAHMDPRRQSEPNVKVAARTNSVSVELVLVLGLVVLLIGASIGL